MKYALPDLERMRTAIWTINTLGVAYRRDQMARTVEAQLVTYMMNETTADELESHARGCLDRYLDAQKIYATAADR